MFTAAQSDILILLFLSGVQLNANEAKVIHMYDQVHMDKNVLAQYLIDCEAFQLIAEGFKCEYIVQCWTEALRNYMIHKLKALAF